MKTEQKYLQTVDVRLNQHPKQRMFRNHSLQNFLIFLTFINNTILSTVIIPHIPLLSQKPPPIGWGVYYLFDKIPSPSIKISAYPFLQRLGSKSLYIYTCICMYKNHDKRSTEYRHSTGFFSPFFFPRKEPIKVFTSIKAAFTNQFQLYLFFYSLFFLLP